MKTPVLLALAFATTALAACDPQGGDDALVGTFTRLRADTTEVKDQWAFTANATMTFNENKPDARDEEDHVTGSYTASEGVIVATATNANAPGNVRVTFTYYANGTVFSSHAMRASGGHDGIVGESEAAFGEQQPDDLVDEERVALRHPVELPDENRRRLDA